MPKHNRIVIVQISDLHSGHVLGLLNPETELQMEQEDGSLHRYNPKLRLSQIYLWGLYEKYIVEAVKFAGDDDIVLLVTGDIVQGIKHREQQITSDISDQIFMGEYVLRPWYKCKNLKKVRISLGTGAHNFGEGASEKIIANMLSKEYKNVDTKAFYHGLLSVQGVGIDYAHHGASRGSRNWLRGNEARYYLRSILMDEIQAGRTPPHLVLRGHFHSLVREYLCLTISGVEHEAWFVMCPAMCLIDDYARKVTRSQFCVTNGIMLYEIVDGKLSKPIALVDDIDMRTKETL